MQAKNQILLIPMVFLAVLSLLSVPVHQAKASRAAPVGYWKFDEGSGSIAKDSSGMGNDGTIHGATWTNGKFGGALSFSTTSNSVYVQSSTSLEASNAISVMGWVKLDGLTGTFQVICTRWYGEGGEESTKCFVLEFHPNWKNPWFKIHNAAGQEAWATSNVSVTLGEWTHIAGTYDGTNIRIYINGVLTGIVAFSGQINPSTAPLKIGGSTGHGDQFLGTIDEVKIYNYARTAEEIWSDYIGIEPTPFWMQWWFWAIIALGIVAIALTFTTAHYRKKTFAQKEAKASAAQPSKDYKVCPNCGANLPRDSKFCGKCGASLE